MTDTGLPHLPGVATVSEILTALEAGYTELKFFPAEAAGGANYLKSVQLARSPQRGSAPPAASPPQTPPSTSRCPNVGCVGGSWITPPDVLAARDWARVTQLAADAAAL